MIDGYRKNKDGFYYNISCPKVRLYYKRLESFDSINGNTLHYLGVLIQIHKRQSFIFGWKGKKWVDFSHVLNIQENIDIETRKAINYLNKINNYDR